MFMFLSLPVALLGTIPMSAVFLMTQEEAVEIDGRIDLSACNIDNRAKSRYFWYDFIATENGFLINPLKARFAIRIDDNPGVHAIAELTGPEDGDMIQTFGLYNIREDKLEEIKCVPR